MIFQNRFQAGLRLAEKLSVYQKRKNLLVLAIPRGGVVVGKPLAERLNCSLDVIVTKKIGAPGNPELAIGAVGPASWDAEPVIDEELATKTNAGLAYLGKRVKEIKKEVARREKKFRGNKPPLVLKGKTVVIVDDGVATGATILAATEVVRQQNPKKIIVAVPVMAKETLVKIEKLADEVICLHAPALFFAVGQFYQEFDQVADEEVVKILDAKS